MDTTDLMLVALAVGIIWSPLAGFVLLAYAIYKDTND
jgi:hypothetical protein